MASKTLSITAQNTFTDGVRVTGAKDSQQDVAISISNTFVATVTIQRSLTGNVAANYHDLPSTFSAPTEQNVIPTTETWYRVGVKTGDFTSGTVDVAISI